MRPAILLSSLLVIGAAAAGPSVPVAGKNAAAFIPSGWHELGKAAGDLNGDGVPDLALVLGSDQEKKDDPQAELPPRLLVAALGVKGGGYRRAVVDDGAVLGKHDGGVFGDPFADLRIERRTLVVEHYGGSRDRWSITDRYRWRNGGFEQIGHTDGSMDSLNPDYQETKDFNLSTGLVEETRHGASPGDDEKKPPPPSDRFYYRVPAPPLSASPPPPASLTPRACLLRQRADIVQGRKEWKGPDDLSAVISAAMVGGERQAELVIRALVRDDRVLPGDTGQLVTANGTVVKPLSASTAPAAGGYVWTARYAPAAVGLRYGRIMNVYSEKARSGWGVPREGVDDLEPELHASIEVVDADAAGKTKAVLSTGRSGRAHPASIRLVRSAALPRLGVSRDRAFFDE